MSFRDDWIASRRLFVLRLLAEVGGQANEGVIYKALTKGGFAQDSRDDLRQDLDHLKKTGCTAEEWLNDSLRVVKVTERGEDAAYGRIAVSGVERSRWDR